MNNSGSPDGLKFGHKIYFEDMGIVAPAKTGGGSTAKKGGKGVAHGGGGGGGQPPVCQVEGCKIDLSDAKTYYVRHKVCCIHSKSPQVVVAGLQQRFCQQCSRFHQLSEFDQGKRSCRRRLAGHNERRRKPPSGSSLSSRIGHLSSSLFGGNTNRNGGFLLDFSSYPRPSVKDPWLDTKPPERVPGNHSVSTGKYLHNMWPGNSEDPPEMFLQGSVGVSSFPIPPGECITGVSSDSSCALSLLSNQTWGSRNRASGNNLMNLDGASTSHCTGTQTVTVAHLQNRNNNSSSWGFKTHEDDASMQVMTPDHLGLGQISQPHGSHFPSDLMMDNVHNGGRHYMEVDHSRAYNLVTDSHVHWSLS